MSLEVKNFYDLATATFTYVVYDSKTLDAIIIDPVWDFDIQSFNLDYDSVQKVLDFINSEKLNIHLIAETHVHADHITSSQFLRKKFPGSKIAIGKNITKVQKVFKKLLDLDHLETDGSQFDVLLDEGQDYQAGSITIKTLFTPGHTPACCCYLIEDNLFTGDSIFMPDFGTGRCDFPEASAEQLFDSIKDKIYSLPDATKIFVGHDYAPGGRDVNCQTTVGEQKTHNIHVKADTACDQFVEFRTSRDKTLAPPKLLYPSIQINAAAGKLNSQNESGLVLLHVPVNVRD